MTCGRPQPAGAEGGFALVFVIFTIMVMAILGALTLLYTVHTLSSARGGEPSARALAAAETGIEVAHARLSAEDSGDFDGELWNGRGSYRVEVVELPPRDWLITSYGEYRAAVDGVERTFYRTIEQRVTFAGVQHYDAFNYIVYSKEGKVDISYDGDKHLNASMYMITGDIYAGGDVIISDQKGAIVTGTLFTVNGSIYSESGDILLNNKAAIAVEDFEITGGLYAREGGVHIDSRIEGLGISNVNVMGDIQAGGRLRGSGPASGHGVYLSAGVFAAGGCGVRVGGPEGNVYSDHDVVAMCDFTLAGAADMEIRGSVHSGGDFSMEASGGAAGHLLNKVGGDIRASGDVTMGGEMLGLGSITNEVWGSIRASGDVSITSGTGMLATGVSQVLGGIYAKGDVDIEVHLLGGASFGGYTIGGDIYAGGNVDINTTAGMVAEGKNRVHGNVYASRGFSLRSDTWNLFSTIKTEFHGSIYAGRDLTMEAPSGVWLTTNRIDVMGGVEAPAGVPGVGVCSNRDVSISVGAPAWDKIFVWRDGYYRGTWSAWNGVFNEPAGAPPRVAIQLGADFAVPQASDSEFDVTPPGRLGYEVMMPECDFEYFRSEALRQEAVDGKQHYYEGDTVLDNLTIFQGGAFSSHYVIFVDGDLTINNTELGINSRGYFVATGHIVVDNKHQALGTNAFNFIAGETVRSTDFMTLHANPTDELFIYAAHNSYEEGVDEVSVDWDLSWFKNIRGQITARGDVLIHSGKVVNWGFLGHHEVTYRRPAVLSGGFRIPLEVVYWKEL